MTAALLSLSGLFFSLLGLLLVTVSFFWILVLSFRESLWWGLGILILLVPIAPFCRKEWEKVQLPTRLGAAGTLMVLAGVALVLSSSRVPFAELLRDAEELQQELL